MHRGIALVNADSKALLFTPHTPNVGYGWFVTKANGRPLHHVNGRSPGFSAQADYYPDDDVSVVVLSNTYVSVTTEIARAVGAYIFRSSGRADGERSEPNHRPAQAVRSCSAPTNSGRIITSPMRRSKFAARAVISKP